MPTPESELLQVIDELIALERPASEPEITDVLAALGYIVALQNAPEVGGVIPGGLAKNVLESLVMVVKDWVIQRNARGSEDSVAGFMQKAGEHVQRLRTTER